MATALTESEEAQLAQTIEMFEVITRSQPLDYQSLEILKEAYLKLGRESDVIGTSKRIAEAYVQMGQLSSAILEYETILQRFPDDPDVQAALKAIENKANNVSAAPLPDTSSLKRSGDTLTGLKKPAEPAAIPADVEDGRKQMRRLFVDSKLISAGDFELCWPKYDSVTPNSIIEPFVSVLDDKDILAVDKALKVLSDKSRCAYLPMNLYDLDMDFARTFPAATCRRWCVLPFDRMSKSVLVATVNPFNQQAAKELSAACNQRLLWYLVSPVDLVKYIRKAFH